jgi:hypothetical protein
MWCGFWKACVTGDWLKNRTKNGVKNLASVRIVEPLDVIRMIAPRLRMRVAATFIHVLALEHPSDTLQTA